MHTLSKLLWALCSVAAVPLAMAAGDYPSKPIKIVSAFPAGTAADNVARFVADELRKKLQQAVIVENKVGANGLIATHFTAAAAPDGYTLFVPTLGHVTNPLVNKNASYDPVKSFSFIGSVFTTPNVLVFGSKNDFGSLPELIRYAKAHPDKVNYASSGVGSSAHLTAELFQQIAGVRMTHVPYAGTNQAFPDLVAGNVALIFSPLASSMPLLQHKELRTVAVTSGKRLPQFAQIPTIQEAGSLEMTTSVWYGLVGPAGLPAPVVEKLGKALEDILKDPAAQQKLAAQGGEALQMSAAEFQRFVQGEYERWAKVVKATALERQ